MTDGSAYQPDFARLAQLFAGTATIATSDEREKEQIAEIATRIMDAWDQVRFSQFRFRDAVEAKGDRARLHFGLVAQQVLAVFEGQGLDPFEVGILCWDSWPAQEAVYEEMMRPLMRDDGTVERDHNGDEVHVIDQVIVQPARAAGDRYGVRYEEALILEAACQRRRLARIEQALGLASSGT